MQKVDSTNLGKSISIPTRSNKGRMYIFNDLEMYFSLSLTDGSSLGIIKMDSTLNSIWYQRIDCSATSSSVCYSDTIAEGPSSSIILGGTVFDKADSKTLTTFSIFLADGTWQWDYLIEQASSILSNFYTVHKLQHQSKFVAILEYSISSTAAPILVIELDSSGQSKPTSHTSWQVGNSGF